MTHTLKHTLGRSNTKHAQARTIQHNTYNDFHSDTSCCFLTNTFNDFSMIHSGIYCVREQKIKKIPLINKLFMDTLLLLCFCPIGRAKFVLKFLTSISTFHIFIFTIGSTINNNIYIQQ